MEININIEMDNAAFSNSPERELSVILRRMARNLDSEGFSAIEGKVFDTNGNSVGLVEVAYDADEDDEPEDEDDHVTMILPAHWASYLINSDTSDEETVKEVNEWSKREDELGDCMGCSEEPFFSKHHDAMPECKACNCLEYTFNVS